MEFNTDNNFVEFFLEVWSMCKWLPREKGKKIKDPTTKKIDFRGKDVLSVQRDIIIRFSPGESESCALDIIYNSPFPLVSNWKCSDHSPSWNLFVVFT